MGTAAVGRATPPPNEPRGAARHPGEVNWNWNYLAAVRCRPLAWPTPRRHVVSCALSCALQAATEWLVPQPSYGDAAGNGNGNGHEHETAGAATASLGGKGLPEGAAGEAEAGTGTEPLPTVRLWLRDIDPAGPCSYGGPTVGPSPPTVGGLPPAPGPRGSRLLGRRLLKRFGTEGVFAGTIKVRDILWPRSSTAPRPPPHSTVQYRYSTVVQVQVQYSTRVQWGGAGVAGTVL